jgi:16S rRNA G966 N2-methylase RsmD
MRDEKFFVSNLDFAVCLDRYRQKFDLIFIDPPYKLEAGAEALKIIGSKGLLDGIAVYERDRAFEGSVEGLELFDERKYGKTYLSFFKKA